jgi:hypothetical protein
MNGGCMDTNLIVITNTDWLIDWLIGGFLVARRNYFMYIQNEKKFNNI